MQLFSRIRALQRRLPPPLHMTEEDFARIDAFEAAAFGYDDDNPRPPGPTLGDIVRAYATPRANGQKAPRTDKNSRFALPALVRRLLPRPCPVP